MTSRKISPLQSSPSFTTPSPLLLQEPDAWRHWRSTAEYSKEILRVSQERLETALQAADMASREWLVDADTLVWTGNARRVYGLADDTSLPTHHQNWLQLVHPEDRDHVDRSLQDAVLHGKAYEVEFRVAPSSKQDGSRWLRETGEVFLGDDDQPSRLLAVALDVTGRRRVADALRQARCEAAKAEQARTEFLVNVSHEIRTPIAALLGFAELLGDLPTSENRGEYLRRIRQSGERILSLVDGLLTLSKAEAGVLDVELAEVTLFGLIDTVREALARRAKAKGLSLTFHAASPLPRSVVSDPLCLRQILVNVVGNAVKFTERGSVSVSVTFAEDGTLTFVVRDTGNGLTDDVRARLFQPFQQGDGSATRTAGGLGVGLALARRLARRLGGDVQLTSTGSTGSVFMVTVACTLTQSVLSSSQTVVSVVSFEGECVVKTHPRPLAGATVLVADDSLDNRLLLGRMLHLAGAQVEYACDGREAVVKGREDAYDAVLMDLQMPETDGYQATRSLRSKGVSKPIIAITAHAIGDEQELSLAAGCTGYLTKPLNHNVLVRLLAQQLSATSGSPATLQSPPPQRLAANATEVGTPCPI